VDPGSPPLVSVFLKIVSTIQGLTNVKEFEGLIPVIPVSVSLNPGGAGYGADDSL
jgi:hypothetical protein